MLAQCRTWPQIHEKRSLCLPCEAMPICPVSSRCWPHTGLVHVSPDLNSKCTLLHTGSLSVLCTSLPSPPLELLMHISPSKPAASSHGHMQLLFSQMTFLRCGSEHIARPQPCELKALLGPCCPFPLTLCICCSFCLCHCSCQVLVPGRMLNLPEVVFYPSYVPKSAVIL